MSEEDNSDIRLELQRLEGWGGGVGKGGGGLAYKMQVEGLLEKTKVTEQREWHFM